MLIYWTWYITGLPSCRILGGLSHIMVLGESGFQDGKVPASSRWSLSLDKIFFSGSGLSPWEPFFCDFWAVCSCLVWEKSLFWTSFTTATMLYCNNNLWCKCWRKWFFIDLSCYSGNGTLWMPIIILCGRTGSRLCSLLLCLRTDILVTGCQGRLSCWLANILVNFTIYHVY